MNDAANPFLRMFNPSPVQAPERFPVADGMTREAWLNECAQRLRPLFERAGYELPAYRVTMSLTSRKKHVGECWDSSASEDGVHEILIRLDRQDSVEIAAILAHELCHAAVGLKVGHGPTFKKAHAAVGLIGKPTCSEYGDEFRAFAVDICREIGEIPHKRLNVDGRSSGPKKQNTYLIKAECLTEGCGYTVRVTAKWLKVGPPGCPLHGPMHAEMPEDAEPEEMEELDEE